MSEHELVLGQEKVSEKSNEKTAIPELLKSLDLKDALVSCDAGPADKRAFGSAGCQLTNADLIVEKQGHYLIALKRNQKHLYEQVSERMEKSKAFLPKDEWVDFGSGRMEKRVCYLENHLDLFDDLHSWKHLKSIIMIESSREKNGITSQQTRFYLSDVALSAKAFNHFIRNHWSIENRLHWKLDVVFREDIARTKTGNAAQNLATARKLALQMLNQCSDKESIKNRRKMAGWDDNYLIDILSNINQI